MRPVFEIRAFVKRHLSPADRLAEALCGLIMVLTFTLVAAPHMGEGREGVRNLLLATVGCNIAWGIIDGVLYVLGCISNRARRASLARGVRQAPDEASARAIVRGALEPGLEWMTSEADRETLYRAVVRAVSETEPQKPRATPDDWLGGVAILVVEVACTVPATLPFLLLGDRMLSLRVSNAVLLLLLFVTGYAWGKGIGVRPIKTGLVTLLLGAALVAVAIALGG
jgi:hypothetical protein